ncbi:MAG: hypothetical protein KGL75_03070 [Acidobacteriota bacterium]|nr:hypothetical protein [Acidobacteriota bacterium]
MPQSILIFDFGANEESAQQARHKVEAWKQGFRLGNKMLLKFEREETAPEKPAVDPQAEAEAEPAKAAASAAKSGKKKGGVKAAAKSGGKAAKASAEPPKSESPAAANGKIRLLVRLDFSDHEKLSHQRWLDRIPTEEPFKSADGQTIRSADPEFQKSAEHFDSLD